MPFGLTSSPFILNAVRKKHVDHMGPEYQLTASQITEQTYVGDVFGGAQTMKKVFKQAKDSAAMCESAGMELFKWQTNCDELRALIDPRSSGAVSSGVLSEMIAVEATTKGLGVQWETNDDSHTS